MAKKSSSATVRSLVITVVVIGMGLYGYFTYLHDPLELERKNVQEALEDALTKKGRLEAGGSLSARTAEVHDRIGELEKELKNMQSQSRHTLLRIANASDRAEIIHRLNNAAERNGLKVHSVTPIDAPSLKTLSLLGQQVEKKLSHRRMVLNGRFHALRAFGEEIASIRGQMVLIEKIDITVEQTHPRLRAVIELGL